MARRKNVIAPEAQTMDLVAQKRDKNLSVVSQIFSKLGILGTEYDSFLFIQTAKNLKGLHENSGVALGAVIRAIKENEPHGSYIKALEQIDIHRRKASRYMHIADRFGKWDKLSHLTPSKFDVIDALTDPELEKLIEGEEVKGLTLDAIDELPATEARKRLREAEKKLANQKERYKKELEAKQDEIKDLTMRASNMDPPTKEQLAGAKLDEYLKPFNIQLQDAIFAMNRCIDMITEIQRIEAIGYVQLNDWVLKQSEDIASLTETFTELQDAINDIHIDRGDEADGQT